MHFIVLFERMIKGMACFFVDYENGSGNAIEGISFAGLKEYDEIIIFYSKKSFSINMERHKELEKVKAKKYYIKVEVGTENALDFQLSTFLGACINYNPHKKYYIVSKDQGFDCVCHFWNDKGIYLKRIEHFYNFEDTCNNYI